MRGKKRIGQLNLEKIWEDGKGWERMWNFALKRIFEITWEYISRRRWRMKWNDLLRRGRRGTKVRRHRGHSPGTASGAALIRGKRNTNRQTKCPETLEAKGFRALSVLTKRLQYTVLLPPKNRLCLYIFAITSDGRRIMYLWTPRTSTLYEL